MHIFEKSDKACSAFFESKYLVENTKKVFPEDVVKMLIAYGAAYSIVKEMQERGARLTEEESEILNSLDTVKALAYEKMTDGGLV